MAVDLPILGSFVLEESVNTVGEETFFLALLLDDFLEELDLFLLWVEDPRWLELVLWVRRRRFLGLLLSSLEQLLSLSTELLSSSWSSDKESINKKETKRKQTR